MPKELTHWILAEQALAKLDSTRRLSRIIRQHHDLYLAGAVLPDTLLHLFRGPHAGTALALAHRFHDATGNSFAPLISAEQNAREGISAPLTACLLGVITHMQVDITFHPFVYALAGTGEMGEHYRIETDIDCHFLHCGMRPPVSHLSQLLSPAVRETLVEACGLLFDPDGQLPRQEIDRAICLHSRFQQMYDNLFWKLAARAMAIIAGNPYRQQRYLFYPLRSAPSRFGNDSVEWRHPVSGETQHDSLEHLAETSVARIAETFEWIEIAGSLAHALEEHPGQNLLTGMLGACLSAMNITQAD